ncbi:MAG TPA: DMT family transporter [Arachidicoccus sp.]|nr:DMT family transporter [Arachidicoccus sp.]
MLKNIFLILLGGCSFGILSTFVKLAYGHGFSLADVTSAQAYFGALILWSILIIFKLFSPSPKAISATISAKAPQNREKTVMYLILTGMTSGCISICYYKCVQLLPASIAIILLMQYTWISMLLERLIFKKPLGALQLGCLAIILVGTLLGSGIVNNAHLDYRLPLEGIVYGLLAGFFYAVFILSNGYVGNYLPAIQKSSWIVLGVCVMIMVVFPPFAPLRQLYLSEGHALWAFIREISLWGLLLGFFGMVLPPLLFAIAIPKTGVALSSILGSVELPTAAICAYFILGETITWIQLIGILLILVSIILINLRSKKITQAIK